MTKGRVVNSLPVTTEEINDYDLLNLVQLIIDLTKEDTEFKGISGMQVNTFLAYAAVRLAKEYALDHELDALTQ